MKQLFSHIPIRTKLAGSVIFSILMFVALSIIHIASAQLTSQDIETIHRNHQRMVLYTQIQQLSTELADVVYSAHTNLVPFENVTKVSALLREEGIKLLALPANPEQAKNDQSLVESIEKVIVMFAQGDSLLDQIDLILNIEGPAAQGNLSATLLQPRTDLVNQLTASVIQINREIDLATEELAKLPKYLIIIDVIALIILCLTLGTALFLTLGRLMSALGQLEKGATAFSQGDFSFRTNVEGKDELKRLSGAFDNMATKLEKNRLEAEDARDNLEKAVAQRTSELAAANKELAAEDVQRRNFLADVSHELRLPITIIKGDIQVTLREVDRGEIDPVPVFARILRQAQTMERLIKDLFLIARGVAGGLTLNYSLVDLGAISKDVVDDFSHAIIDNESEITFQGASGINVSADSDRVRQMLLALLDNAVKHAGSKVKIKVETAFSGSNGVLKVTDNGKGFTTDKPIGRFLKGSQQAEGAGLGLAVTKTLAEAQGGFLEIENTPEGGGCVRIFIPLCSEASTKVNAKASTKVENPK